MMSPTLSLLEERGLGAARRKLVSSTIARIERWILHDAAAVLTDTSAHIDAFKEHFQLQHQQLEAIPVAADETFQAASPLPPGKRTVLFYGSFLPLHGATYILNALRRLSLPGVTFHFVGGSNSDSSDIARLRSENTAIEVRHDRHIPFDTLIGKHLAQAWLCLGGPFGGTPQAKRVVTGKTAQALAMAVPTMVGESPAACGLIDRKNCLAVPQRDADGIAASIKWAYHNPTALAEIGNAGQAHYREHLSMSRVKDSLGSLLRRLS
ncbi:glycosyltransferase [Alkalilimnicola sp. S0819]|uniref:glycosyltransferase n=1 Tax=Alkalilimnicola sp. S0819 TaxID=2613922 RepID=UPI00186A0211|nr:glycosyltransferase [Alkalilimnicola sp. S0819]